jgi:hypothetical protein
MCFMALWLRFSESLVARLLRASGDTRFDLVEPQRRRQVAVGVDLLLAFGEFLLGHRDRVGTGYEPERRLRLVGDGQQGLGELGGSPPCLPSMLS